MSVGKPPVHNDNGTSTWILADGDVATLDGGGFADAGGIGIQCTANSSGTITVAVSNDGGTTKTTALLIPVGSATGVTTIAATTGAWRVDTSGFTACYATCAGGTATLITRTYRG